MSEPVTNSQRHIEVTSADLPLHCPMPSMMLWNAHPRVYLPIQKTGEAMCPYCGTKYTLAGGAVAGAH
ncbi:MAG: zinc-finger domain-containing protein [Burkholderiales bacterium]